MKSVLVCVFLTQRIRVRKILKENKHCERYASSKFHSGVFGKIVISRVVIFNLIRIVSYLA